MNDIKEINIEGERIFLKKNNLLGWAVVNPYKVDGKISWKNILIGGNWVKFGITLLIIGAFLFCLYDYSMALKVANECLVNTQPINLLG